MTWTGLLGPILIVSEADRLAQEGLTARWQRHIDPWDRRLVIFLILSYIYIVVPRPNVRLSYIWLPIRESLSSTAEAEVSTTSHSCLVAFRLEISEERVT